VRSLRIGIRHSAFAKARGLHLLKSRPAISRLIGTVDLSTDRWHQSGVSGFRHSGFPEAKKLRIVDSRSVKSRRDVACGTAIASGVQVEAYRSSGFGDS
jgi:hypothetical protein